MWSAEEAKNTETLIADSTAKILQASTLFDEISGELSSNRHIARKVTELVGDIAVASQEQAQGINQINNAVAEMDKVVQQNATNAGESASASEEMNAQARYLKNVVGNLTSLVGGESRSISTAKVMEPATSRQKGLIMSKKEGLFKSIKKGAMGTPPIPMHTKDDL